MNTNPLVSIICITFNHAPYLRDCLDGFVNQQTNFSFEVLVHDDASRDDTQAIIREYAAKYPHLFRTLLQTENQFSQGKGFVGIMWALQEGKGKYFAYCEGDDYWTDPLKLQKQVDFLEAHPAYAICAHDTMMRSERYAQKEKILFSQFNHNIFISKKRPIYTFRDTLGGNIFHLSSMMFRNVPLHFPSWINQFSAFDMVWFMLIAEHGDIYWMPDVMSVYRDHSDSITNSEALYSSSVAFNEMSLEVLRRMNEHFDFRYKDIIEPMLARYCVYIAFLYLRKGQGRNTAACRNMLRRGWKYNAWATIRWTFSETIQMLKRGLGL